MESLFWFYNKTKGEPIVSLPSHNHPPILLLIIEVVYPRILAEITDDVIELMNRILHMIIPRIKPAFKIKD